MVVCYMLILTYFGSTLIPHWPNDHFGLTWIFSIKHHKPPKATSKLLLEDFLFQTTQGAFSKTIKVQLWGRIPCPPGIAGGVRHLSPWRWGISGFSPQLGEVESAWVRKLSRFGSFSFHSYTDESGCVQIFKTRSQRPLRCSAFLDTNLAKNPHKELPAAPT